MEVWGALGVDVTVEAQCLFSKDLTWLIISSIATSFNNFSKRHDTVPQYVRSHHCNVVVLTLWISFMFV